MEGRNVGTIGGESPKQDLFSAKDLPIELLEGYIKTKICIYVKGTCYAVMLIWHVIGTSPTLPGLHRCH